jgi:DnaJ-class molecular chaperone
MCVFGLMNPAPSPRRITARKLMTEKDTRYTPRKCGLCNGRGKYLLGKRCPACGGQGSVLVHSPAQRCAFCRGLGTNNPFTREDCPACSGSGWAHAQMNDAEK